MTIVYVLSGITLAIVLAALVVGAVVLSKIKNTPAVTDTAEFEAYVNAALADFAAVQTREFRDVATNVVNTSTSAQLGTLAVSLENRLNNQNNTIEKKLAEMREETTRAQQATLVTLEGVRKANEEQIKEINKTVDEKLQATVTERFNSSFGIISQRMQELQKGFEEMQSLDERMKILGKLFSNVKTRGTWGEVSLEALISQLLTPEQYRAQYTFSRNPDERAARVDFAIVMPGKGDEEIYLPVDSKFPTEDYQRLVDASENGDAEKVEQSRKSFLAAIEKEARDIKNLYIKPGKTTDFAVLYVPVEGMFDEVARAVGFVEKLQAECRIVVAGPTTFAALLNSLRMGFRTVALEKSSAEIRKAFEQFVKDFSTFSQMLDKARKQLATAAGTIDSADTRTLLIRKRLAKFSGETGADDETEKLLEAAATDDNGGDE